MENWSFLDNFISWTRGSFESRIDISHFSVLLAAVRILPMFGSSKSYWIAIYLVRCLIFAVDYHMQECNTVGFDCVVWSPPDGSVEADEVDFEQLADKVTVINGSFSLINSSLSHLPRAPRLKHIAGSLVITNNTVLAYKNQLEGLLTVEGGVAIHDNPHFRIPVSLYKLLCLRKDSKCNVDASCYGNIYIRDDVIVNLDPLCTVLIGNMIRKLSGMWKIHSIFGAVRLIHNQVDNFGFLLSIRRIEFTGQSGCALSILSNQKLTRLGLDNLREITTVQGVNSTAKTFCILKNRRADTNQYYRLESDEHDSQIFLPFRAADNYQVDNETGTFDWSPANDSDEALLDYLLILIWLFLAVLCLVGLLWLCDFVCKQQFCQEACEEPESEKKQEVETRKADKKKEKRRVDREKKIFRATRKAAKAAEEAERLAAELLNSDGEDDSQDSQVPQEVSTDKCIRSEYASVSTEGKSVFVTI